MLLVEHEMCYCITMHITTEIKQKIETLAEKHALTLVVLFGSQATGKTHPHSDVDIGVMGLRPIDFGDNYNLQLAFSNIFKRPDIEVVNLRNVSPLLLKRVADHGILLFEKEKGLFTKLKIRAFKLYVENQPLFALGKRYVERFLEKHA